MPSAPSAASIRRVMHSLPFPQPGQHVTSFPVTRSRSCSQLSTGVDSAGLGGTPRIRRRKYMNVAFLIIDEVGFEPMSRRDASLFFRLVSYRYGRGSILITTNKGIRDWPEILAGDEVLATAILDRLLHRSHVLNIKGRSYRLRDLERAATRSGE